MSAERVRCNHRICRQHKFIAEAPIDEPRDDHGNVQTVKNSR
jgi:hypothetical protein